MNKNEIVQTHRDSNTYPDANWHC